MPTGQASTQAMQVVQAHSVCCLITSPASFVSPFPAIGPVGAGRSLPVEQRVEAVLAVDPLPEVEDQVAGESGPPATWAGQATWQRPHLVQASKSTSSFQVKSPSVR